MANYVKYSSNNSGGSWWLSDDNWRALEAAGWEVDWVANWKDDWLKGMLGKDGRYLGCLAKVATRRGLSLRAAAEEWESVTGQSALDAGCACCGQPHDFTEYTEGGDFVASGPEASYRAAW